MLKVIKRSFYALTIMGLVSTSIQAAAIDQQQPLRLMICDGTVETIHRSMDRMACQPPASIDAQLAEYKAPDALMRKVIQGLHFVSPAVTDSVSRSHLNRLYGQMLDLHHNGGGLTMPDFYLYSLILATIISDPAGKIEDVYLLKGLQQWASSKAWLEHPFREQPLLPYDALDNSKGQYGGNTPAIIFDQKGHFGLNEITHSFLRQDKENRRHLISFTQQPYAHGGNINQPLSMMTHDFGHASIRPSLPPSTESLLSSIFERISSWSGEKLRQIEYALFHILHEDTLPRPMPTGRTQKELGSLFIEKCKENYRAPIILSSLIDGEDIHSSLNNGTALISFNLDDPAKGVTITADLYARLPNSGVCVSFRYDLVYKPNLEAPYEATFRSSPQDKSLSPEEEASYKILLEQLPRSKTINSPTAKIMYRDGMKDEVATLKWLHSGRWSLRNAGDTWQNVKFYLEEMPRIYDVLLEEALEIWTDAPVPAELVQRLY